MEVEAKGNQPERGSPTLVPCTLDKRPLWSQQGREHPSHVNRGILVPEAGTAQPSYWAADVPVRFWEPHPGSRLGEISRCTDQTSGWPEGPVTLTTP